MLAQDRIRNLASEYSLQLQKQIDGRIVEMQLDNTSHWLIYRVLGISDIEAERIDRYQNIGRFVYRFAGGFIEKAAIICLQERFADAKTHKILNPMGGNPKKFEIDCLVDNRAYEIKWRDATTDGDHITKEHARLKAIANAGYQPIRLMFFYPNRLQAIRIQKVLEDLYKVVDGQYFGGDAAWQYLLNETGVDLRQILEEIALEKGS